MTQYEGLAQIYDKLSEHDYKLWTKYILSHVKKPNRIIDAGCGTGSITIELAKLGYNVTAIDISEDMLREAMDKARKNGVRIDFSKQDITKLKVHSFADLVICTCDCINYIVDFKSLVLAFKSANSVLVDGGTYIFDIISKYRIEKKLANSFFGADLDDIAYIWQNKFNSKTNILSMDITFFIKDGDKFSRVIEKHKQRSYSIEEIENALFEAGFRKWKKYKAFTEDEPSSDCDRICFVVSK